MGPGGDDELGLFSCFFSSISTFCLIKVSCVIVCCINTGHRLLVIYKRQVGVLWVLVGTLGRRQGGWVWLALGMVEWEFGISVSILSHRQTAGLA